jgi:hypothetical protein
MLALLERDRSRVCHPVVAAAAAAAVVVAFVIAGCGSVAPVDTFETHEASASALSACTASGAALCERANACSPFWFQRVYTNLATCAAVHTEKCLDRYRGEGAAMEITDCTAAVASLSCEELLDPIVTSLDPSVLFASCPVTPGVFGAGERCLRDGDCTTGRCSWREKGHEDCGTCIAAVAPAKLAKDGESCDSGNACASRWCTSSSTCGSTAKLGEACGDRPCDLLAGLTCGADSLCRTFAAAAVGQACSWTDNCVPGAWCAIDKNGTGGTCELEPTAGVGEDCALGCAPELACYHAKCAAPTAALHKSCPPATTTSPQ